MICFLQKHCSLDRRKPGPKRSGFSKNIEAQVASGAVRRLLNRKAFQVAVRFSVLIEFRFVVQCRVGDSKAAHLIFVISFDIGNAVNFGQIASHGSGTATSDHIRHTEGNQNRVCGSFG